MPLWHSGETISVLGPRHTATPTIVDELAQVGRVEHTATSHASYAESLGGTSNTHEFGMREGSHARRPMRCCGCNQDPEGHARHFARRPDVPKRPLASDSQTQLARRDVPTLEKPPPTRRGAAPPTNAPSAIGLALRCRGRGGDMPPRAPRSTTATKPRSTRAKAEPTRPTANYRDALRASVGRVGGLRQSLTLHGGPTRPHVALRRRPTHLARNA